ncbi:IF factor, partial [Cochlearius cochlearius]|nr:IF factor [Cochlearius cochlearius]
EKGGMIGNIYSMGLALQALGATRNFYAPREWNCTQAFSVVYSHDYRQPMAIAQVLPALVGKSYLQAASLSCAVKPSVSPSLQALGAGCPPCPSPPPGVPADITVHYSIINKLQGSHFHYTTEVQVPAGSTLLRVLQKAEEDKPNIFSFKTKPTSWGPMVVSIHGLAASTDDRTYWQFFSGQDSLQEG